MPAEIVPARFCADYWGVFKVYSSSKKHIYTVTFDGGEGAAHCDCPAFKYSKEQPRHCKHIDETFKKGCFWNPQWFDGGDRTRRPISYTSEPDTYEPCPACGGPTVVVRIAV